jgi:hypothetical protein
MPGSKKRARPVSAPVGAVAKAPAARSSDGAFLGLSRGVIAAIVVVVWVAAFVRLWASFDEFWMDEIWSLFQFADEARSPWDVFTFHHDNNHYLVTLWMYVLGVNQSNWTMYRVPSIVAGIGTVILASVIARRWGPVAATVAAILTGASYMLICMASEARGYALAGFFALAAFLALDRFLNNRSFWAGALFATTVILGTLSHLTFVDIYFALFVWSCFVVAKRADSWSAAMLQLARLHATPLIFMAALYLLDVRQMKIGGGDVRQLGDVIASSLALVLGSSNVNPLVGWLLGVVVIAAASTALVLLARAGSDLWIFFLAGIFVAPTLLLIFHRPELIYERYFYLNLLLLLLLLSYLASCTWKMRGIGIPLTCAALLAIVAANAWQTYNFLRVGRGHFRDALEYIIESEPDQHEIHFAGDGKRDRTVLYLQFHGRYAQGYRFFIDDIKPGMAEVPSWLLVIGAKRDPPRVSPFIERGAYELRRSFPFAGLSGMNIAVYRWQDAEKSAPQVENPPAL